MSKGKEDNKNEEGNQDRERPHPIIDNLNIPWDAPEAREKAMAHLAEMEKAAEGEPPEVIELVQKFKREMLAWLKQNDERRKNVRWN